VGLVKSVKMSCSLGGTVRGVGIGGGREYWEEYCSGMGTRETASYWQRRAWPYGVYCMQARPTGAALPCYSQLGSSSSSSRQASRKDITRIGLSPLLAAR
jgi:hypothetical protein